RPGPVRHPRQRRRRRPAPGGAAAAAPDTVSAPGPGPVRREGMSGLRAPLGSSLVVLALAAAPLRAGGRELKTVESAAEAVHGLSRIPLNCIPQSLVQDAAGVAVIPHVLKAGLLIDGRFGRGVVLAHEPGGRWSNPVFITLAGGGVGGQIGVE